MRALKLLTAAAASQLSGQTSASSLPFQPEIHPISLIASTESRNLASNSGCAYDCNDHGSCITEEKDDKEIKKCECENGWWGDFCQSAKTYCGDKNSGMYCLNGGVCVQDVVGDTYKCDCNDLDNKPGGPFYGKHCESNPTMWCIGANTGVYLTHSFCTNGGKCNKINKSGDLNHHGCDCVGDYTDGDYCEYKKGKAPKTDDSDTNNSNDEKSDNKDNASENKSSNVQSESDNIMGTAPSQQDPAKPEKPGTAKIFFLAILVVAFVAGGFALVKNMRQSKESDTSFERANYDERDSPGAFVMGDLSLSPSGPRVISPTQNGEGEGEII
mmetsp:Transcript_22701/g.52033  ORF Transcript_22701/g.52033 Transcript_22701/m.52033 type:complete len:328 (-) Transcript_22701:343-1326(-)|eukprot:CAMPEP_0113300758 /NCGR_PEP_ID=MMETSP0010_2-20120614/2253_1 /TAXON_ID=216773 ORGANISM="Corethron hystrix, Strain 308" /NCGR_SAMPLE_ID=MMETSP0010_2 /ASSEMBLY_ACC=CAM_ASM_000155 /LENGTH=327 /DNA_ID=CAMNT_0000154233 /DNA_START=172 /DNA_END=1155 /DNA_ORIENTATION=- /assembly_acc=CAM_ASM_000155